MHSVLQQHRTQKQGLGQKWVCGIPQSLDLWHWVTGIEGSCVSDFKCDEQTTANIEDIKEPVRGWPVASYKNQ